MVQINFSVMIVLVLKYITDSYSDKLWCNNFWPFRVVVPFSKCLKTTVTSYYINFYVRPFDSDDDGEISKGAGLYFMILFEYFAVYEKSIQ